MSWFPCGALRAVDVQHRRSTIREGAGQLLGRGALRHHLCGFHHSTATQPSVAAQLTHGTFITLHICALFGVRSLLKDPRGRSHLPQLQPESRQLDPCPLSWCSGSPLAGIKFPGTLCVVERMFRACLAGFWSSKNSGNPLEKVFSIKQTYLRRNTQEWPICIWCSPGGVSNPSAEACLLAEFSRLRKAPNDSV